MTETCHVPVWGFISFPHSCRVSSPSTKLSGPHGCWEYFPLHCVEVVLPARCLGSSKTQGAEQVHLLVGGRACRPRNLTYFFPWENSSPRHSSAAEGLMAAAVPAPSRLPLSQALVTS